MTKKYLWALRNQWSAIHERNDKIWRRDAVDDKPVIYKWYQYLLRKPDMHCITRSDKLSDLAYKCRIKLAGR